MIRRRFTGDGVGTYGESRRISTTKTTAATTSGNKAKSKATTASGGFNYGNSNSTSSSGGQTTRYPPWESESSGYRGTSTRPFSAGQQIPRNFHEYHFRNSFATSSASKSTAGNSFGTFPGNAEFAFSESSPPTRKWEHTGLGALLNTKQNDPTLMGGGVRFTMMCYNILAPGLLEKHPELYKKCDSEKLNWNYRCSLLFQEIATYNADIICLQEMQADQYEHTFEPRLNALGFRGVYKKKTGEKEDGCAIFYRTSKFLLLDKLEVELLQPHVPLLNRDNIGLLVKLETRNVIRRQKLVVGTTHLLFNPKRQEVKLAQAQLLLAELDRFAFCGFDRDGTTLYHPILMTGDFNCIPYSPTTKLFSDGRLQYLDENGDLIKLLKRKRINSLLPRLSGISDQCQHYKIILERYKRWKSQRTNNFELDLRSQDSLVNIFPYLEAKGLFGSTNGSDVYIPSPPDDIVSLLSPPSGENMDYSLQESNVVSSSNTKLLSQAAEKVGKELKSVDVTTDISTSPSREQLYFPEQQRQAQLELNVMEEVNRCGLNCDFASGTLSHNFNFRDIYTGKLDRQGKGNETVVTTKQNGWTCVDYIYQSMTWHRTFNKMVEGKLKLVRRLGLFTRSECKNKDIPNDQHPSDHFPLVAEFLLRN